MLPQFVRSIAARALFNPLLRWRDSAGFGSIAQRTCDLRNLRSIDTGWLAAAMQDASMAAEWPGVEQEVHALGVTTRAHGVNAGDRRALYNLVRALQPESVLEVGTHIGASTVHIVAALRKNPSPTATLATVDIVDVNDPVKRPWEGFGARFAPADLVARMQMTDRTRFVAQSSLDFLVQTNDTFDLIFLDGGHSASIVYQELPAALARLNPGGTVLLHDYFPAGKPLWSDGAVIPGPWLATERLRTEGARMNVLPLGALPWMTKQQSHVTSLAVVVPALPTRGAL